MAGAQDVLAGGGAEVPVLVVCAGVVGVLPLVAPAVGDAEVGEVETPGAVTVVGAVELPCAPADVDPLDPVPDAVTSPVAAPPEHAASSEVSRAAAGRTARDDGRRGTAAP